MNFTPLSATIIGVILAFCVFIGTLEFLSERTIYRKSYKQSLNQWCDASESQIADVYARAIYREFELLDCRYDYNSRSMIELEALIDALERVASERGYKLPKDDEIFNEEQ